MRCGLLCIRIQDSVLIIPEGLHGEAHGRISGRLRPHSRNRPKTPSTAISYSLPKKLPSESSIEVFPASAWPQTTWGLGP